MSQYTTGGKGAILEWQVIEFPACYLLLKLAGDLWFY